MNSRARRLQWHAGTGLWSAFTRSRLHTCSGPVHAARALNPASATAPPKSTSGALTISNAFLVTATTQLSPHPTRHHSISSEPHLCIHSKPLYSANHRDCLQGCSFPNFTACNATRNRLPCRQLRRRPSSKSPSRRLLRKKPKNPKRAHSNKLRPTAAVHQEMALPWLNPSSRLRSSLPTCRRTLTTRCTPSSRSRS